MLHCVQRWLASSAQLREQIRSGSIFAQHLHFELRQIFTCAIEQQCGEETTRNALALKFVEYGNGKLAQQGVIL